MRRVRFVKPPRAVYADAPFVEYVPGARLGYGEYNYLRPGLASWIRLRHFALSLRLTRAWVGKTHVIDYGCADGVFLPSLAHHFRSVVGVDANPGLIDVCGHVVARLGFHNVDLVCSHGRPPDVIRDALPAREFGLAFLLEVLEHVGERDAPWTSRVEFLLGVQRLLGRDGRIMLTVPRMTGPGLLLQRLGLRALGAWREPLSARELVRAAFLRDTTGLEARWRGHHVGFNERKLRRELERAFVVEREASTPFQCAWLVRKR